MSEGQGETLPWEETQTPPCSGNALELELQNTRTLAWRCCFHLAFSFSFIGANLTEKIRKIKIVFTPTICKQTCRSGRCYNNCEKGDTTTLYSQGGHNHDPKSGFRICEHPEALNPSSCLLPYSPLSAFPPCRN